MGGREDSKRLESRNSHTIILKKYINNCSNYRGIILLSVVLKVYERIIEKRVKEMLDKQLEESQSGFRKESSFQDHIFTLKQIPKNIHVHDQKIFMGFVDILKAFDSVPRNQNWHSVNIKNVIKQINIT